MERDSYSSQLLGSSRLRRFALIFAGLFVLIFGFIWFYTHSYIQVNLSSAAPGEITYELVDQKTNKSTLIKSSSTSIKKLVKKSSYEVLVKQNESNFLSVVTTKPFLKTSEVRSELKKEKVREFIGDNPNPCMFYDKNLLFTYSCGSTFGSLELHLPATPEMPTTSKNPSPFKEASLGGIVNYKNQKLALLGNLPSGDGDDIPYRLYVIDDNLELGPAFSLPNLTAEKSYSIKEYREGFIIYDSTVEDILFYNGPSSEPQKIDLGPAKDSDLSSKRLFTDGNRILVSFSSADKTLDYEEEHTPSSPGKTEIKIYDNGNIQSLSFDENFSGIELCGDKYLCLVKDRQLFVYDISNSDAPNEIMKLNNVHSIISKNNRLIVARYDGVFEVDILGQKGFMQYSFGAYTPCGMQNVYDGGYVVCVISPKNTKAALYIDPSKENVDNIDKKVLSFLEKPYISNVSVYKKFFYLSPDLGEFIYDSRTDNFTYDPEIINKTSQDIDSLIKSTSLNVLNYTVIDNIPR